MPHRRRVKKNSFGGHFDDLVKHFPAQPPKEPGRDEARPKDERGIHERLFDSAWRRADEARPRR